MDNPPKQTNKKTKTNNQIKTTLPVFQITQTLSTITIFRLYEKMHLFFILCCFVLVA